jgi:hypothetical protein
MGTVNVKISSDGSSMETEVNGIKGSSCEEITTQFLSAIGSVEKSERTQEYYEAPINNEVELGD